MPKNKKVALDSRIQTNQILTNHDKRLYSILLAVHRNSRLIDSTERSL